VNAFSTPSNSLGGRGGVGGLAPPLPENLYLEQRDFRPDENLKKNFPKVLSELEKVGSCGKKLGIHVCFKCGKTIFKSISCKSRLCPKCSKKLHKERTKNCMKILKPYLQSFKHWSHIVFTLPDSLRFREWDWSDIKSIRSTATRICRQLIGFGGVSAVHTFSSHEHGNRHIHVHCLVFGRRLLNWNTIRKRWGKFLKRRFGYEGEVDVWENWFINGRGKEKVRERKLRHRVRYILRLPSIDPSTYWHFELLANHQSYCYFGLVVNDFKKRGGTKERKSEICSNCGGKMKFIGEIDDIDKTWIDGFSIETAIEAFPELVEVLTLIHTIRGKWAFERN